MQQPDIFKLKTVQVVAYTGTAGASSAIGADIRVVRLVATSACHVAFGSTATTSSMYLAANVPEYFRVNAGTTISAIQVSAGGNLHIGEMTK